MIAEISITSAYLYPLYSSYKSIKTNDVCDEHHPVLLITNAGRNIGSQAREMAPILVCDRSRFGWRVDSRMACQLVRLPVSIEEYLLCIYITGCHFTMNARCFCSYGSHYLRYRSVELWQGFSRDLKSRIGLFVGLFDIYSSILSGTRE